MSLTARDKKLILILVPVVVVMGYWFLLLAPQRTEVSKLDQDLITAESGRDEAVSNAQRLTASKTRYAADYATVVRLGKAIPSSLDMPSLLVQLESAAKGTGIDFDSITVGQRTAAAPTSTGTASASPSAPVASGGQQAQTGAGKATEQANEGADQANQASQASGGTTSSSSASGQTAAVPGLDTVPLNFTFQGSYFELADFFHRVKRFVRVVNEDDITVKGRLMTIGALTLTSKSFPRVTAELTATIYLSPKSQGTTGGGTAQGPTSTPTASSGSTTTPSTTPSNTDTTQNTGEQRR